MGELRLPSERSQTAEFSITFTLAGNWKGRGHSLSLRIRSTQQHLFEGINPPLLPWCDLIHIIFLEQTPYFIIFYQWQFQVFNCRTQGRLAQSHVRQPWESARIPAEQLGWEAGGMAEKILIHLCRTDTAVAWILMWEFSKSLLVILPQEQVKLQGDKGAWSLKKDEEETMNAFPVNTGSDWTNKEWVCSQNTKASLTIVESTFQQATVQ